MIVCDLFKNVSKGTVAVHPQRTNYAGNSIMRKTEQRDTPNIDCLGGFREQASRSFEVVDADSRINPQIIDFQVSYPNQDSLRIDRKQR